MKKQFVNVRTQTILKHFHDKGTYILPDGSPVIAIEARGNGPCKPVTRILHVIGGKIIEAKDGSCVRFQMDALTGEYVNF